MHTDFINLGWNGLWWSLAVGYAVLILCVIAIVISENRNPLKALG
ncbi:hypothetical protein [uncultured Duncaniella sp.]|nr:hypothetical protein [uncultured Duncaniella sp.]